MTRSHADPDVEGLLGFRPEARARSASSTGGGLRRAEAHESLSINEDTIAPVGSGPDTDRGAEPRWPLWAAMVTAWTLPATTAERTNWVSLKQAWGFHILAGLTTGLVILVVVGWTENLSHQRRGTVGEAFQVFDDLVGEFDRDPETAIAVTAGTVAGVEAGFLLLGLAAAAWGARDEPMKSSVVSGLRRAWIQTPHAIPVIVVMGLSIGGISEARRQWHDRGQTYPASPYLKPNPTQEDMLEHTAAMEAWHKEVQRLNAERYRRQPWCVIYEEEILSNLGMACGAWFLWAVLRAGGARRRVPRAERPPTCEFCGYNLTATPIEGRCPECGTPAVASLGPGVRPGTEWERQQGGHGVVTWWKLAANAIRRPEHVGRQLRVADAGASHLQFFARCVPLLFAIGAEGVLLDYRIDQHRWPRLSGPDREVLLMVMPAVAYLTVFVLIAPVLAGPWLVALYYRIGSERNLLGAATQMACYLAGYVVLWASAAHALIMLFIAASQTMRALAKAFHMPRDGFSICAWFGINAILFMAYVWLIRRGVEAARYANR